MIIILTSIFILLSALSLISFFDAKDERLNRTFFAFLGLLFFCIAAFRPPFIDRDYAAYAGWLSYEAKEFVEPSFTFIAYLVNSLLGGNPFFLFFIYAAIGVYLKFKSIKIYADFWLLSIIVYLAYSFPLHEMTQIRAGVAGGFILLTLKPLHDRNWKLFALLVFLGLLFHVSSIFAVLLWFLNPQKFKKWVYLLIVPLSYLATAYVGNLLTAAQGVLPAILQMRAEAYDNNYGLELNIYNTWQLMRCFISVIFILKCHELAQYSKYAILLSKIYIWGTALFVIFSFNPVFAGRISDLFIVFDILSLPLLVFLFSYRPLGKLFVIGIAATYIFMNLYYNKIFG